MKKKLLPGDRPCAFHLFKRCVTKVPPSTGKAPNLPRRLVIPPGRYRVHGRTYELNAEGLYRFIHPMTDNQQRIVYRRNALALISGLCWLQTHGNRDDQKEYPELAKQALTEKLIRTCGPICAFAGEVLVRQGIRARAVNPRTLEEPNSYNNGHVLLEALLGDKWVLFDIDQHAAFIRNGKRLSLLELLPWIPRGDYRIEWLSASIALAIGGFADHGYDWSLWSETVMHSEKTLREWYRRIMMLPVIYDGGQTCFTARSEAARQKAVRLYPRYGVNFLPWEQFREKFYPNPK